MATAIKFETSIFFSKIVTSQTLTHVDNFRLFPESSYYPDLLHNFQWTSLDIVEFF